MPSMGSFWCVPLTFLETLWAEPQLPMMVQMPPQHIHYGLSFLPCLPSPLCHVSWDCLPNILLAPQNFPQGLILGEPKLRLRNKGNCVMHIAVWNTFSLNEKVCWLNDCYNHMNGSCYCIILLIVCWYFKWFIVFNPLTCHFTSKEIGFKREGDLSKLIQTSKVAEVGFLLTQSPWWHWGMAWALKPGDLNGTWIQQIFTGSFPGPGTGV